MRRLQSKFASLLSGKQVICLGIPDEYVFMDEELIELLKNSVSEYIEVPN
ncbi:putative protein tyrosine phosphatase [Paenibacillus lupini]|nr:putative protein tyrosine phosphatase [Paenibacillus lupini]